MVFSVTYNLFDIHRQVSHQTTPSQILQLRTLPRQSTVRKSQLQQFTILTLATEVDSTPLKLYIPYARSTTACQLLIRATPLL